MQYIDQSGAKIDTDGLPEELIAELSCSPKRVDAQLIGLFPDSETVLSLDAILVRMHREHGVSLKRKFLMHKLYRLSSVITVDGRKGVYKLHPDLSEPPTPKGEGE
jgi:hypothetical protein